MFELFGRKKRDGFFVEAGAHNGVEASNTLYFEKKMGWKGLLVEPNPDTFKGQKYTLAWFQLQNLVRMFGHYTLKYLKKIFFLRKIGILGTFSIF